MYKLEGFVNVVVNFGVAIILYSYRMYTCLNKDMSTTSALVVVGSKTSAAWLAESFNLDV